MARFTTANARDMAAKSVAKRKANELDRATKAAQLPPTTEPEAEYDSRQIARVRAHLERVDCELDRTKDAQEIERLARARGALAEQERIARGKPLPGQYRPEKQRVAKRTEIEPL